jgi:hypothetical protein
MYDVNARIARIAHDIRDFYARRNDGLPTLTTPDALHLATAIAYECAAFYTLDAKNRPDKNRSLLSLSGGLVAGRYRLEVAKPTPTKIK